MSPEEILEQLRVDLEALPALALDMGGKIVTEVVHRYHAKVVAQCQQMLDAAAPPTPEQLAQLLEEHWLFIKGEMVGYTAFPELPIHQVFYKLAESLSALHNQLNTEIDSQKTPIQFLMPDLQFESESDHFPSLDCREVELWGEKDEKALRRLTQLNASINRKSPKSEQDKADQARFQLLLLKKERVVAQQWYADAKLIDVVSSHVLSDKGTHLLPVAMLLRPEQRCSPYDPSCQPLSDFEQQRLWLHNPTTRSSKELHAKKEVITKDQSNLLGQLKFLCKAFEENDAGSASGTEALAGESIFTVILTFSQFYDALSAASKATIPAAVTTQIDLLLEYASDKDKNKDIGTCLQIRRKALERVMEGAEVALAKIAITVDDRATFINELDANLAEEKATLQAAILQHAYRGEDHFPLTKRLVDRLEVPLAMESLNDLRHVVCLAPEEIITFVSGGILSKVINIFLTRNRFYGSSEMARFSLNEFTDFLIETKAPQCNALIKQLGQRLFDLMTDQGLCNLGDALGPEKQQSVELLFQEKVASHEFFEAIDAGDIAKVTNFLDKYPYFVNLQNKDGDTPLMTVIAAINNAIEDGDMVRTTVLTEMAKLFLSSEHLDISLTNEDGSSVLFAAAGCYNDCIFDLVSSRKDVALYQLYGLGRSVYNTLRLTLCRAPEEYNQALEARMSNFLRAAVQVGQSNELFKYALLYQMIINGDAKWAEFLLQHAVLDLHYEYKHIVGPKVALYVFAIQCGQIEILKLFLDTARFRKAQVLVHSDDDSLSLLGSRDDEEMGGGGASKDQVDDYDVNAMVDGKTLLEHALNSTRLNMSNSVRRYMDQMAGPIPAIFYLLSHPKVKLNATLISKINRFIHRVETEIIVDSTKYGFMLSFCGHLSQCQGLFAREHLTRIQSNMGLHVIKACLATKKGGSQLDRDEDMVRFMSYGANHDFAVRVFYEATVGDRRRLIQCYMRLKGTESVSDLLIFCLVEGYQSIFIAMLDQGVEVPLNMLEGDLKRRLLEWVLSSSVSSAICRVLGKVPRQQLLQVDEQGRNRLMHAVSCWDLIAIQALLGASHWNFSAEDNHGRNILYYLVERGDIEIFTYFVNEVITDLNSLDTRHNLLKQIVKSLPLNSESALSERDHYWDMFRLLLAKEGYKCTALQVQKAMFEAIRHTHAEAFEELFSYVSNKSIDIDYNGKDDGGRAMLRAAIQRLVVIRFHSLDDSWPFHWRLRSYFIPPKGQSSLFSIIQILLSTRAVDVNVTCYLTGGNSVTPLMLASANSCEEIVQQLLRRQDIDVNFRSPEGDTAITLADRAYHNYDSNSRVNAWEYQKKLDNIQRMLIRHGAYIPINSRSSNRAVSRFFHQRLIVHQLKKEVETLQFICHVYQSHQRAGTYVVTFFGALTLSSLNRLRQFSNVLALLLHLHRRVEEARDPESSASVKTMRELKQIADAPYRADPSGACSQNTHHRLQEAWRLYEAKVDTQVGIQLLSEEMVAVTGPTT